MLTQPLGHPIPPKVKIGKKYQTSIGVQSSSEAGRWSRFEVENPVQILPKIHWTMIGYSEEVEGYRQATDLKRFLYWIKV